MHQLVSSKTCRSASGLTYTFNFSSTNTKRQANHLRAIYSFSHNKLQLILSVCKLDQESRLFFHGGIYLEKKMSALKRINGSSQPTKLNILGRALVELCMGRITTVCRLNIDHDIVSYGSQKEFIHCRLLPVLCVVLLIMIQALAVNY